ncbi:hypothetical protein WG66_017041, partial [Moniliophthora roreri]
MLLPRLLSPRKFGKLFVPTFSIASSFGDRSSVWAITKL